MSAAEFKEKANNYFKAKDYDNALKCFTEAINLDPKDHIHYSNRSACYFNMGEFDKALEDAEKCIEIKPDFSKGFQRKGLALLKLNKIDESIVSLTKGSELDPASTQIKDSLAEAKRAKADSENPMKKNYHKLFTDPKTSAHMKDPQFANMLQFAINDQKMLMQLMQSDPRFMDVFAVLTGIDLGKMGEESEKATKSKGEFDQMKRKDAEEDKKKNEDERKRKEEERKRNEENDRFNSMPEEERNREKNKKESDALKLKGNEEYKKKNVDLAFTHYEKALELNPTELSLNLNLAACYFEKKDYDNCLKQCEVVIDNTNDFVKKARAYGRMAFVYAEKGDLEKSIECFNKSLLEHKDERIKDELRKVEKLKKIRDEELYINPELAEEHNNKANDLYKAGKYPDCLKEYSESIKRNPKSAKYYSNRAAAYIKLLAFNDAREDCDKAISLDPMFLRAYQRKAVCHMMMKEYHKAMDTYDKGMKIKPDDKELMEGKIKCMEQIRSGSSENDEERVKHAYADPEIRGLLTDPRIQQLFKDFNENPKAAQDAVSKDKWIADALNKLVAAGVVKTK
jgi:stress-induced-phosphoprotein 1